MIEKQESMKHENSQDKNNKFREESESETEPTPSLVHEILLSWVNVSWKQVRDPWKGIKWSEWVYH